MKRRQGTTKLLTYYGGEPVTRVGLHAKDSFPLAAAKPGDRLRLDDATGSLGVACCERLGLTPGAAIRVVSKRASGSVIFALDERDGRQIGVGAALAQQIWVGHQHQPVAPTSDADTLATSLREMLVGSSGRVVGYEWAYRGYMGKLLSLGLAPGAEFVVRCWRSRRGTVELELAGGRRMALNAIEAKALIVEPSGCEL